MNVALPWPGRWPLALRVPLLAAGLVIAVAVVVSHGVLERLARDQQRHLSELAATYLDGLATALQPAAVRRDVWEAFDVLDRARQRDTGLHPLATALVLPDGTVLAAADPRALPSGAALPAELAAAAEAAAAAAAPRLDEAQARAVLARDLREGDVLLGRIVAELDIAPLLAERAEVRQALLLVNSALTLGLAAVGFGLVRRLMRPLELLRAHAAASAAAGGRLVPVPEAEARRFGPEFAALFAAWNRTAGTAAEREALAERLAEEERYALLGKLASGMAHEVNNPLGGMMMAVDTIATHGADPAVREASVGFLRRGLADIRNVVRASLVTYKGRVGDGPLLREDLDDLRHLIRHEVTRRGLVLEWENTLPERSRVDRTLVRQVALNLLLNAAAASPQGATLRLEARPLPNGGVRIEVADAGPGLPPEAARLLEISDAPPPAGGGLGLWTALRLANGAGGRVERLPSPKGTRLAAEFPAAHMAAPDARAVLAAE
jgi:two-component system OmpR family sensor kinase